MGKLGRKICCNYNKDVKCILLVKGHKSCIFEETTENQKEKGERQFGVCALLPRAEREQVLETLKKDDKSAFRSWTD